MKTGKRIVGIAVVLLGVALLLAARFLPRLIGEGRYYGKGLFTVSFLDVGQADACLIGTPAGEYILVDAGNADDDVILKDELWLAGADRLALVVGTHPHEDHIGAMADMLQDFDVEKLVISAYPSESVCYARLMETAERRGVPWSIPTTGDVLYHKDGVTITVVYDGNGAEDGNNASLMLRVTYGQCSLLLAGDAEASEEALAMAAGQPLAADLLKLGHHGSSDATSDAFLRCVSPAMAVISCGRRNDYGHPHSETLDRLARGGITLYRTDQMGTIRLASDGTGWKRP